MVSAPPSSRSQLSPGWMNSFGVSACVIVIAVMAVFGNALQSPFLFDDTVAVVSNPTIEKLGSLAIFQPPADGSTTTGRPLVNASLALNFALSGHKVWSYHLFNVLLHAGSALLLMAIVRGALSGPIYFGRWGEAAPAVSFGTALLWALHPLVTETVVCVAQRTEGLCAFFYLLTLATFLRAAGEKLSGRNWFVAAWLACLAGMASKEVMVTAPVVVLLFDRTFLAGTFAESWRRRRGFYFALAGTWMLLGLLLWRSGGSRGVAAGFGLGISWWSYLLTQCQVIVLYVKLAIWPNPLVLDYGTAVVRSWLEVWWQGPLVLVSLGVTCWALVRRPLLGFVGAWFFLILSPSSSVVPLVTQTIAEHRMYLPLAGLVALLVALGQRTWGIWFARGVLALALAGAVTTLARNRDYRDVVTIWSDNVAKLPRNERAENNLAWALQQQGRGEEANVHFARAVELQPNYVSARYNWGAALLDQKRVDEALTQFAEAVRLAPAHADAHLNLGNALMQAQRAPEAIAHYAEALRLKPGLDAHYNLGVALFDSGRSEDAAAHLRAALALQPNWPEAHYQLGRALEALRQNEEAAREYAAALKNNPAHMGAHRRLGLMAARAERLDEAAEHFRAVIQAQPDDVEAHANLGNVFFLQNRPREAVTEFELALKLRPQDARLRESLQVAREALR